MNDADAKTVLITGAGGLVGRAAFIAADLADTAGPRCCANTA